jgi:GT2 family glycosyltransferase/glycosyltransferase involved in cell wall biosynthesis
MEHTRPHHKILVIDDCSPAGRFSDQLPDAFLATPRLRIVRNQKNMGFVATCNWAMEQTAPADVVLLNSDTEVTPGWLDKLQRAAAADERVGTVTPLTNNGTICSVPEFLNNNSLPPGCQLSDFAALVESSSAREYPMLPTCVGFCVYIKREVLDRIGGFDAEAFGKGYGEENDFSCRLQAVGYRDVLDDATFVYHHGSKSFQAQADGLIAEHLKILDRKHPDYGSRVQRFIAANPLRKVHQRIEDAIVRRWNENARYSVLHLLHYKPLTKKSANLPGGVEYHVADLVRMIPEAAHWSLYVADRDYHLTAHLPESERTYRAAVKELDLSALLRPELFDVVHVHHTLGFDFPTLAHCLLRHGQYFVSVHDYSLCCPVINLLMPDGRLCSGRECCTACHQQPGKIRSLRSTTRKVLENARAVFHYSKSTKAEFSKILDGRYPWRYLEHGVRVPATGGNHTARTDGFTKPSADVPLKVAFLGAIGPNKGANLVRDVVKRTRLPSGVPIQWHLIGIIDGELDPIVHQHGRYEREQLGTVMKAVNPHVAAILSIWPETYCCTFEEALVCGVPVISTPLGAPAERLREYGCGWIVDSLSVDGILESLQRLVDNWDEYCAVRRRIPTIALTEGDHLARRHHEIYRDSVKVHATAAQLPILKRLFAPGGGHATLSFQRLAASLLNAGLAALQAVKLRRLAAGVARRLLSMEARHRISTLRQLALVAQPACTNEWFHKRRV